MITTRTGIDHTDGMNRWATAAARRARARSSGPVRLRPEEGFAQLRHGAGQDLRRGPGCRRADGRGLFAAALLRRFPLAAGRGRRPAGGSVAARELHRAGVRVSAGVKDLFAARWTLGELVRFHTAHKMSLLAHSTHRPTTSSVGWSRGAGAMPRAELRQAYDTLFMADAGDPRDAGAAHQRAARTWPAISRSCSNGESKAELVQHDRRLPPRARAARRAADADPAPRARCTVSTYLRGPDLPRAASARADAAQPCLSIARPVARRIGACRVSDVDRAAPDADAAVDRTWPRSRSRSRSGCTAARSPSIMRTPATDRELAAGFLFVRGGRPLAADIGAVEHCRHPDHPDVHNVVDVFLLGDARGAARRRRSRSAATSLANSSCGTLRPRDDRLAARPAPTVWRRTAR